MNVFSVFLAILPGLAIAYWIYLKDEHEKEPHGALIFCFILGMLSTIPAIFMEEFGTSLGFVESDNIIITAIFAFVVVAGSEEFVKFAILRTYPFPRTYFNEPLDGIVYSVMIGMGFATLENLLYVMELGVGTGVLRMFTAVPAHGAFAVIMGYFVGLAKFDKANRLTLLFKGFFGAVFLHGAYDFFLFQRNFPGLAILAFVALYLGIRYSRKLIEEHQIRSPFSDDNREVHMILEGEVLDEGNLGYQRNNEQEE